MAFWKQALLSLVVIIAAAFAWAKFFPGADQVLARYDLAWVSAALGITASETRPDTTAQGQGARGQGQGQGQGARGGGGQPQTAVVAEPVRRAVINDRLTAIGTGRANQSVVVIPFSAGLLTELAVQSGARVEAGEVIAKLDSAAEEIARDRADVALADAGQALERVNTLRRTNTASGVQVTEAELAVRNAELQLREAELNLDRRDITAPIAGIVGILPVDTGNYVTTQTQIATIDDRSLILIDFWVPERFAGMIRVGSELAASLVAQGGQAVSGTVSAVDNRIDEASRTLRVQARVPNPDDRLRAGMSFRVEMRFPGDSYPAVDPLAVQWGADGAFVWAVRDGMAERVPIRIVQRNTETVLVDADLSEGTTVVTQGIHAVRQGAPVLLARNTATPPAAIPEPAAVPQPTAAASGT